jgi:hypothetical protein
VARGHVLIFLAALAAGRLAHAAGECDEERGRLGLAVGVHAGRVTVAEVTPESAAARAGLRTGDVLVQANDVLPRSCAQWARAVAAARDERKALLVLVHRGDADIPLGFLPATWGAPAAEPSTAGAPGVPPPPVAAPARQPPPPPPPPLPPETAVSVEGVVRDIAALAPAASPPTSLPAYRDTVLRARREVETLAARKSAPEDVVTELRAVMRYYEGAEVAWEAIEGDREREHLSRRLPVADNMTQPYFSDSPVASLLEEFDFLEATVAREPSGGHLVEASGLWRPVWARLLLWERGGRALDALRARLHL